MVRDLQPAACMGDRECDGYERYVPRMRGLQSAARMGDRECDEYERNVETGSVTDMSRVRMSAMLATKCVMTILTAYSMIFWLLVGWWW